jgi:hypothetical protein
VPSDRFSDAELDAAVAALSTPERLAEAQEAVARLAPQLQRVLNEALKAGGWFGDLHDATIRSAAAHEDPEERARAVATLVAEETRVGMLVGVTVGLELAAELQRTRGET